MEDYKRPNGTTVSITFGGEIYVHSHHPLGHGVTLDLAKLNELRRMRQLRLHQESLGASFAQPSNPKLINHFELWKFMASNSLEGELPAVPPSWVNYEDPNPLEVF